MKKTILFIVLATLCLYLKANAQDDGIIKPLKVGDHMPNLKLNYFLSLSNKTIDTTTIKGKLIILDFWNTWCTSCIAYMPLIDSLQQEFKAKVQFIAVTNQTRNEVSEFLVRKNEEKMWKFRVPEITDDTTFSKYFIHRGVPYFVWIDAVGEVSAFTSGYRINERNIKSFLESRHIENAQAGTDIDPQKPLYTLPSLPKTNLTYYSVLFQGELEHVASFYIHSHDSLSIRLAFTNKPLSDIFHRLGAMAIPGFNYKQLLLDVKQPSKLFMPESIVDADEWVLDNLYSLDIIIPRSESAKLTSEFNSILNKYTPYIAKVKKRKIKVLKLVRTPNYNRQKRKEGEFLNQLNGISRTARNIPIRVFTGWINSEVKDIPMVIDDTGIKGAIDLQLPQGPITVPLLNEGLGKQFLKLIPATEDVTTLIITDK